MKLVKNNKVEKLRKTRVTVEYLVKNINNRKHEMKDMMIVCNLKNGELLFASTCGISDGDYLLLAERNYEYCKKKVM